LTAEEILLYNAPKVTGVACCFSWSDLQIELFDAGVSNAKSANTFLSDHVVAVFLTCLYGE